MKNHPFKHRFTYNGRVVDLNKVPKMSKIHFHRWVMEFPEELRTHAEYIDANINNECCDSYMSHVGLELVRLQNSVNFVLQRRSCLELVISSPTSDSYGAFAPETRNIIQCAYDRVMSMFR